MKRVTTWVANTAARLSDVIEAVDERGAAKPMLLTGVVSSVTLMGVDTESAQPITPRQADVLETSDPATRGQVDVAPSAEDVTSPRLVTCWWRLVFLDGGVLDTGEFLWEVEAHGVQPTGAGAEGDVALWASNADVARYASGEAPPDVDFTPWIIEASELLYVLSGRQYPGVQRSVVRPTRNGCSCWQVLSRGHVVAPDWLWDGVIGRWRTGGMIAGCGRYPAVRLSGDVVAIDEVRVGGVAVDPQGYRVDHREWLVRLTDPTSGVNPGWPACQDASLPDDAPGTFSVAYRWGETPPLAGVRAAGELAWQLYLENTNRGKCRLPVGWTTVARQGVTVTKGQAQGQTGIVGIDTFLRSANPGGVARAPAVYSPDVQPFAQRLG